MKKFNALPIKLIKLKDLKSYTDIKGIFRREGILRYLYTIKYKGKVIKYGISHKIQEPADRIYTQIGHMLGWDKPLLLRSKKTTGNAIAKLMQLVDPENFHKNNVELEIYDFTNYDFELASSDRSIYAEMQNAEEYLKKRFFDQYGSYPLGNIKQEGFRVVTSDKEAWNICFGSTISASLIEELPRAKKIELKAPASFNTLFD